MMCAVEKKLRVILIKSFAFEPCRGVIATLASVSLTPSAPVFLHVLIATSGIPSSETREVKPDPDSKLIQPVNLLRAEIGRV